MKHSQLYQVRYKHAMYYLLSTAEHMAFLKEYQPLMTYEVIEMTDEDELINCVLDIV